MKKSIIIFIIILALISIAIFFFYDLALKNTQNSEMKNSEIIKPGANSNPSSGFNRAGGAGGGTGGAGGSGGGTSGGAGGESSSSSLSGSETKLPSDLYTKECGYYFSSYQVCAGNCPSGKCTQEGKSCYCKIS